MPFYAVAVAVGVWISLHGNQLADPLWSAYAPLLLFLGWFNRPRRALLLFAAATLWSNAYFQYQLQHRLDDTFDNRPGRALVEIEGLPRKGEDYVSFDARILALDSYTSRLPRRVRLNWYRQELQPRAGERWQLEIKLRQPRATFNPAAFDFEKWMFVHAIDARGYVRESPYNRRLLGASAWNPDYWRTRLAQAIDRNCEDCRQAGLIKALALGFRGDMEQTQKRILQMSGTAHLLAISGLHIGLVATFALMLGAGCWRFGLYRSGLNRNQFGSLLAVVFATAYAALAGFSLPTVRALIMLLLVMLALWCRRRVNLLQSLAIAAIAIMLFDPLALGSASFWLSLGALLVIAFAQVGESGQTSWWRQLMRLQLYFALLFAPLGILIFDQLTPSAYLANLVAIPLISFVVLPLVLLACVLLAVWPGFASQLLLLVDWLLAVMLAWLQLLLDSGLASVDLGYPAPLLLTLLLALGWSLVPGSLPGRRLALLLLLCLPGWQPQRLQPGEFEVVFLDVGQGSSVLLRTRHHSLVYDLGPGRAGGYSAAEQVLAPTLRHYRIGAPDMTVISHADQDHSGGLNLYLERFPATRLVSGTPQRLRKRYALVDPVPSCHAVSAWRWDGVDFRFIGNPEAGDEGNNASCVLLVSGHHRLLLPGDIEERRENTLLASHRGDIRADMLLAPHHGSATSSSPGFVAGVAPRFVVHTVGRVNRWNFPDPAVDARYEAIAATRLRSDWHGAIGFHSRDDGLSLTLARDPPRRIWRRW